MTLDQAFCLSKEPDYPETNEDVFVLSSDGRAVALSDGASESFDSRSWARFVCEAFVSFHPRLSAVAPESFAQSVLADARVSFGKKIAAQQLSWSQQAALNRGNFASLIGVSESRQEVFLLAIGDSIAVWQDRRGGIRSWMLTQPEEFQKNPVLLGSDPRSDVTLLSRERARWGVCRVAKSDIHSGRIWLMTDAIAAWVIRMTQSRQYAELDDLLQSDTSALEGWVRQRRYQREMRVDDTTLLTLSLSPQ